MSKSRFAVGPLFRFSKDGVITEKHDGLFIGPRSYICHSDKCHKLGHVASLVDYSICLFCLFLNGNI